MNHVPDAISDDLTLVAAAGAGCGHTRCGWVCKLGVSLASGGAYV